MTTLVETRLGRYEIENKVGHGGFGDVYLAFDPLLQRKVALKVLRPRSIAGQQPGLPESLRTSLQEARAASALNHPGIVIIHDVGEQEDQAYIVMEWIEGHTLREELTGAPLAASRVAQIGSQVSAALARAHQAGIIHRDLKPENIMVRSDEVVKLLDFGLAKRGTATQRDAASLEPVGDDWLPDSHSGQTTTRATTVPMADSGRIVGTIGYMAPEQIKGLPLTPACDLFALGITLYEMTTGVHPFAADSPYEIMQRILEEFPAPPDTVVDLPAGWNQMILELLSREPDERPQAAVEVLHILSGGVRKPEISVRPRTKSSELSEKIVGRSKDLERLRSAWEATQKNQGHFVLVSGEPGIGKTTLIERFKLDLADDSHLLVATGHCSERLGPGEAYRPLLEAMSQLTTSPQGGLIRSIIRGKAPTWFAQLFPQAVSEDIKREVLGANPERMQRELVDAFEEIGRSFSVCLVLEDVHWADEASDELISYFSKRIGDLPILGTLTYRPGELQTENPALARILQDIEGRGLSSRLDLGFLTPEDTREYLARSFSDHRFPSQFTEWVHSKTEGNPLFMADLVRYLVEHEVITNGKGWRISRPIDQLESEIPASGRALVGRIIDRLGEDNQKLLRIASVSGDIFDSLILSDVSQIDPVDLEEKLDRLDQVHGLITPLEERDFPSGKLSVRYRFVHILYQNYLYDKLTPSRRIQLHQETGETLERHWGENSAGMAADLAQHFDRGRVPEKAVSYYLQAAGTEMSKFAMPQAEAFCNRAMDCAAKLPEENQAAQHIKAMLLRGQIRIGVGRFEDALTDFAEIEATAERVGNLEGRASSLGFQLYPLFQTHQGEKLRSSIEKALALGTEFGIQPLVTVARVMSGADQWVQGRLDECLQVFGPSYEEAKTLQMYDLASVAGVGIGSSAFFKGEYRHAVSFLAENSKLAFQGNDLQAHLGSLFFASLSEANLGHFILALDALEEARRITKTNGEKFWMGRFPNCVGWLLQEAMDFSPALHISKESRDFAKQTGFMEPEAHAEVNIGMAAMELGDMPLARDSFSRAEDIFSRDVDFMRWRYRQRFEMGWSEYFLRMGDLDEAREHATQCIALADNTSRGKYMVLANRQLAIIALKEGSHEEAEKYLETASNELKTTQAVLAAWRLSATWADFHRAVGQIDQACRHAQEAQQVLTKIADAAPTDMKKSILASEVYRNLEQASLEDS